MRRHPGRGGWLVLALTVFLALVIRSFCRPSSAGGPERHFGLPSLKPGTEAEAAYREYVTNPVPFHLIPRLQSTPMSLSGRP